MWGSVLRWLAGLLTGSRTVSSAERKSTLNGPLRMTLKRLMTTVDYTTGELYVDGDLQCQTLEDAERLPRTSKVPGKTAIPPGEYSVVLSQSPRFGRVLPEVLEVPNFSGIRIHAGNTAQDTDGCVLVGLEVPVPGRLARSREALAGLLERLEAATRDNRSIQLEVSSALRQV